MLPLLILHTRHYNFFFSVILTFFLCDILGIKEVIFMSDKYHDTTEMTAARRMFDLAGIIYR